LAKPKFACKCKINGHPRVGEINAAIYARQSCRSIAAAFGPTKDLINRHARACLRANIPAARDADATRKRSLRETAHKVDELAGGEPAPRVRDPEAIQERNEGLLAAVTRRRVAADAANNDRVFVVLEREERELIATIHRNRGYDKTTPLVDNRTYTLTIAGAQDPGSVEDTMREYVRAFEAGEAVPALPESWDIIEGELV
jgi:hypothetical protein